MRVLVLADVTGAKTEHLLRGIRDANLNPHVLAKTAEAEQMISQPSEGIVFDTAVAGEDFTRRMRRQQPERRLVAWLGAASSERTADLLSHGVVDVVNPSMGRREIAARLANAFLQDRASQDGRVEVGKLVIDARHGEVRWHDTHLRLTRREREVLHVLAESFGRTVRRESLYRDVWGYAMARGDRSVDVNVRRLRAKLADAGVDLQIRTAAGVGYRLEPVTAL
jgi:DNA-binding response OmpR family regulator